MIDTHAHIYLPEFESEIHNILDRAASVGVTDIYLPAIDLVSLEQMERLPEHMVQLHKMIGIHPCEVKAMVEKYTSFHIVAEKMEQILDKSDFCAIGEIGLDYYWDKSNRDQQKEAFEVQIKLAKNYNLPIAIHNRESTDDMLDLVESNQDGRLKGVWHCFNGTVEEGKRAIDLGLFLGIGGVSTFKNAGVDKTLVELPLERMILETDSPYLAPVPFRGKKNYPEYIKIIAEKLALIKCLDAQKIASITNENVYLLFGEK